jgi:hypothetical protein
MAQDDQGLEARAAARAHWPVRVYRLGEEPEDDLSETSTPEQRLAMIWELSLDAWTLSGRPYPEYSRAEIPVRVIRTGIRSAQQDDEGC